MAWARLGKTNDSTANGELPMQDRHIRYEDHIMLLGGAARNGYDVYHWKPSTQSLFTLFPNLNRRVDPARLGHAFSVHGISGNLGWALAPVFSIGIASATGNWRLAYLGTARRG
mgnify:CR=1 FL=1